MQILYGISRSQHVVFLAASVVYEWADEVEGGGWTPYVLW